MAKPPVALSGSSAFVKRTRVSGRHYLAASSAARPAVLARCAVSWPASSKSGPSMQRPNMLVAPSAVLRCFQAATLALAATVTGAALLVEALAPLPAAASNELGAKVFNNTCAACHIGGKNSVVADRTLDKVALEKYLEGGFSLEAIETQVRNGKGAMPAWEASLDDDEIQAVAAYVLAQSSVSGWGNNS